MIATIGLSIAEQITVMQERLQAHQAELKTWKNWDQYFALTALIEDDQQKIRELELEQEQENNRE